MTWPTSILSPPWYADICILNDIHILATIGFLVKYLGSRYLSAFAYVALPYRQGAPESRPSRQQEEQRGVVVVVGSPRPAGPGRRVGQYGPVSAQRRHRGLCCRASFLPRAAAGHSGRRVCNALGPPRHSRPAAHAASAARAQVADLAHRRNAG